MTSSIRAFWQRLESAVHPDDASVFAAHPHSFNLDYPPPAFIGDVDNAPVVILMLNGGFSDETKNEFQTPGDVKEHIQWLKGERKEPPRRLSSYYTNQQAFQWVLSGDAVIVNACAYRSRRMSKEPNNQDLAKRHLVSVKVHRRWLREEVLPAAKNGTRLIAAHRFGLWDFDSTTILPAANVYYSQNPASLSLPLTTTSQIHYFLRRRSKSVSVLRALSD